jgi:hypothetical protein
VGLDQGRLLGAPEQLVAEVVDPRIGESDPAVHLAGDHLVGVVGEELAVRPQLDAQPEPLAGLPLHPGLEADLPALQVGDPADAADPGRGDPLQPDRLPDAGGARIPDRVRLELPVLFATRLREVGRIVVRPQDDRLGAVHQQIGEVERERRIAPLVAAGERAVHPYGRRPVHGAEVKEQALVLLQRLGFEGAAIPAPAVEAGIAHAARLRLGREGDDDLAVPLHLLGRAPAGVRVDDEIPGPVQRGPGIAVQQGARVAVSGGGFRFTDR